MLGALGGGGMLGRGRLDIRLFQEGCVKTPRICFNCFLLLLLLCEGGDGFNRRQVLQGGPEHTQIRGRAWGWGDQIHRWA